MRCLMFAKVYNCSSCFINLFDIFTKNIAVKLSIRPSLDMRYLAFGLAGYPAGQISGKNSIWCIPTICHTGYKLKL
jgi:hypothetical protein